MSDNPLIPFLSSYGSTSTSDSLVDENVRIAVQRHGVKPIEAVAPRLQRIAENFASTSPDNLILTGTAGDGKTYHIRKYFLELLGGDEGLWQRSGGIALPVPLPTGKTLQILKDLSEVKDAVKAELLPRIAASLLGEDPDNVWLVAANDGQLLKFWRDAMGNPAYAEDDRSRYGRIYGAIMEMLRDDLEQDSAGRISVLIFNLSRLADEEVFNQIVDSIVEHEQWDQGCGTCASVDSCPIRINRELLRGEQSPFRRRVIEVMRVSALNDRHLPIRYILVLVANILLGDSANPDRPLLTCRMARKRARDMAYRHTNPFNNALGLNFRPREMEKLPVFSVMQSFGIGLETNNQIDRFLIDKPDTPMLTKLEAADPTYGFKLFDDARLEYLNGNIANGGAEFENAIGAQRRRLFFLLSDTDEISPWKLTIYQHAGRYLGFTDALAAGDKSLEDRIVRNLIKGINRTLTGMMTEDGEKLWLARSIGRIEGAVGRITLSEQPVFKGAGTARVLIERHPTTGRPQMRVAVHMRNFKESCESAFDLRPLQFEYLMRVADGSLPSSFSRQCQQELRHFALVSSAFLNSSSGDEEQAFVTVLSLSRTGQIQTESLDI
ncbi:MAG: hypothetical protein KJ755_09140 [Alphaproteobacteria bacterium]|nr:hypothetical protein [Alphaproteobacteria bacterium]